MVKTKREQSTYKTSAHARWMDYIQREREREREKLGSSRVVFDFRCLSLPNLLSVSGRIRFQGSIAARVKFDIYIYFLKKSLREPHRRDMFLNSFFNLRSTSWTRWYNNAYALRILCFVSSEECTTQHTHKRTPHKHTHTHTHTVTHCV